MNSDPESPPAAENRIINENGRLVYERHGDDTSLGMTKFYRVDRFEAIGGFVREVMWDGIDCQ